MTVFATPADLAEYLGVDIDDQTAEWLAQAVLFLRLVSADIEADAGVTFEEADVVATLPGVWTRDLPLPAGYVRDVASVTVNGVAVDASGYWWNDRTVIRRGLTPANASAVDTDYDDVRQGALRRDGGHWGGPVATVRVAYTAGVADPADFLVLKALALRVTARNLENPTGIIQEAIGPASFTYARTTGPNEAGSYLSKPERRRLRKMFNRTAGTVSTLGA